MPGALNWLFVPGCEVSDIILGDVLRNPGEGKDPRIEHCAEVTDWAQANRYRVKQKETRIGRRYAAEM